MLVFTPGVHFSGETLETHRAQQGRPSTVTEFREAFHTFGKLEFCHGNSFLASKGHTNLRRHLFHERHEHEADFKVWTIYPKDRWEQPKTDAMDGLMDEKS
jgi:hypothetical protein